ncbi:chloride channel protein [Iodidimonas sp. SYSU 1G8]|uniref:chloride channel protein n=1 Tax=Iodidimonas sp. SYSU 1G8 TaxID=3133967 RepID=UPI0031FEBBF5
MVADVLPPNASPLIVRLDATRRSRRIRVLSGRWFHRLLFIVGGVAVGGVAVLMAIWGDVANEAFHGLVERWRFAPLLVTPVGFAVAVWLTRRFFRNAQGSGIPQAIAARQLKDQEQRGALVSLRIAAAKVVLTLFGMLCGASIGREGPTVQVGASIMYAAGRLSPRRQAGLILAGSAAGVAAAFNTPLAGVVFAIEEMSRSFEVRTSGLIIGSIIVAGLTSIFFLGNYTYFGVTHARLAGPETWLAVPACGLVGGLLGGGFSRFIVAMARGLPNRAGGWIRKRPVAFAALCGLLVAVCGIVSGGGTYGTGYEQVRHMLDDGAATAWYFAPLKLAATALSAVSGIPGGIFSPSLAVGAGIGGNLAWFFSADAGGAVVLLGMVGYFAGVTQAPITSFVIVMEMTDNHDLLLPLMAAAFVAHAASRLVCREGIYHALSRGFLTAARSPAGQDKEGKQ